MTGADGLLALHPVYRSVNRPLTILGVERRLFFLVLVAAGATLNFLGSLAAAAFVFAAFLLAARRITGMDPEMLRILAGASRFRVRYDPGRFEPPRNVGVR